MIETIHRIERKRLGFGDVEVRSEDFVAVEEPLEIRLNGEALSVTMRTPGNDFDLVRGFLYTEQIIHRPEDILSIQVISENVVGVTVPKGILEGKCWVRNFYASSSCGVCGKASIEQLKITRPIVESKFRIGLQILLEIPSDMRRSQEAFDQTGGLHATVIFDDRGAIQILKEDVGRHNAVDKAIGWSMMKRKLPLSDLGLFVSGRVSFEIMQKAIAAGIPIVGAISAPSSLAIRLANEYHVTLVGFVRNGSLNVYYDEGRIAHE